MALNTIEMNNLSIPLNVIQHCSEISHNWSKGVVHPDDYYVRSLDLSTCPDLLDFHLSDHFTLGEVVHSVTASLRGIPNEIPLVAVHNACCLAMCHLEVLRTHLGRPVSISSWYRSKMLNHAVGGVPNSYHLFGRAVDIPCSSSEKYVIFNFASSRSLKAIVYPTFVHVQI